MASSPRSPAASPRRKLSQFTLEERLSTTKDSRKSKRAKVAASIGDGWEAIDPRSESFRHTTSEHPFALLDIDRRATFADIFLLLFPLIFAKALIARRLDENDAAFRYSDGSRISIDDAKILQFLAVVIRIQVHSDVYHPTIRQFR